MVTDPADQGRTLGIIFWEANPATLRMEFLGGESGEPLGHSRDRWLAANAGWLDLVHALDRETVQTLCRRVVQDGAPGACTHRMLDGHEDLRWFHSGFWLRDVPGIGVRLIGVMVEATKVIEKVAALEATAFDYEALVTSFPDLYFRFDADGRIVDYRAHRAHDLYAPPDHFLGKRIADVLPPEVGARLANGLERTRLEKAEVTVVYALPMSGGTKDFEARMVPSSAGQVVAFVRNITEFRKTQEALEQSVSLHRAILDATADGILVIDTGGRVTATNRRFAQIWGLPEDLVERGDEADSLRLVVSQLAEPGAFLESLERLEADEDAELCDLIRLENGRIFERTSLPQRLDGEVVGRVFSFRDVTARHEAETERDRLLQRTQEAVRLRDEFLSIASHELRTPLTSILLALQNLQRMSARAGSLAQAPRDAVARVLDTGVHQVKRLGSLVDDLLDVARIESGTLVLHRQRFDLGHLAQEVVGHLQETMDRAGCPVTLEARSPADGCWDRYRLEQVVSNLLSNAARYAKGAPVLIRVWSDGHLVHLAIQDRGRGISPEQHRLIFERFRRGGVHEHRGLGLGLYIVDRLVRAHGGEVSVRSEPNQGSTFTIRLPVDPPEQTRDVPAREEVLE